MYTTIYSNQFTAFKNAKIGGFQPSTENTQQFKLYCLQFIILFLFSFRQIRSSSYLMQQKPDQSKKYKQSQFVELNEISKNSSDFEDCKDLPPLRDSPRSAGSENPNENSQRQLLNSQVGFNSNQPMIPNHDYNYAQELETDQELDNNRKIDLRPSRTSSNRSESQKKDSFMSDGMENDGNEYDDNYVSLDDQLGKYDVNFKRGGVGGGHPGAGTHIATSQKVRKQTSNEIASGMALAYNSLEQGKDLNDTDPKEQSNSLERDGTGKSMSFSSVPMESHDSKSKRAPPNQLSSQINLTNHQTRQELQVQQSKVERLPQNPEHGSISRSVTEGELSSNRSAKRSQKVKEQEKDDAQQVSYNYDEEYSKASNRSENNLGARVFSADVDEMTSGAGSDLNKIKQRQGTMYKKKLVSKQRKKSLANIQSKLPRSMSFVHRDREAFTKQLSTHIDAPVTKKMNFSQDDDDDELEEMLQEAMKDYPEDVTTKDGDHANFNKGTIFKQQKEFFENFTALYEMPMQLNKKTKCIILPNARWKLIWDFWVVFLLLVVSIIVPFRLAFYQEDNTDWIIIYMLIDLNFVIDMIFTFFSATIESKTQVVQTDKAVIARQYFAFWFWIDFISIIPLDMLDMAGFDANALLRFAKIGKLYKLIRLSRLAKLFKLLKGQNAVFSQFSSSMQLSSGVERIVFIAIFSLFFFHISSCMFVFLAEFDDDPFESWRYGEPYVEYERFDLYVTSVYYVVTTMSTVGYGDISGGTTLERIYCIMLMLIGVVAFNLISGALGALITNYDSSQAALQEKLLFLNNLRSKYPITNELFFQIKKSLQYDHSLNMTGLDMFINELPANLRLEISEEIHRDKFSKMEWFRKIGNHNFRAWVASKLRNRFSTENTYMYQKGDNIDNFYFGVSGVHCFVIPEHKNTIHGVVDPEKANQQKARRKRIMQYFGCEDSIVNTTALIHDRINIDDCFKFQNNGLQGLHKRFFTVQCVTTTESLIFPFSEIDKMKRDFKMSTITFFQNMILQTQKLLYFHNRAMENNDEANTLKIKRSRTEKLQFQREQKQMMTLEEENLNAVYLHMKNAPLNQFSDFSSINFSKGSSSYDTLNTSEMGAENDKLQFQQDLNNDQQDSKSHQAQELCPFNEFDSQSEKSQASKRSGFRERSRRLSASRSQARSNSVNQNKMANSLAEQSIYQSPDIKEAKSRNEGLMKTDPGPGLKKSFTQFIRKDKNDSNSPDVMRMHTDNEELKVDHLNLGSPGPHIEGLNKSSMQLSNASDIMAAKPARARRSSVMVMPGGVTPPSQLGSPMEMHSQKGSEEILSRKKHRHKSYDIYYRKNFKAKMLAQLAGIDKGSEPSESDFIIKRQDSKRRKTQPNNDMNNLESNTKTVGSFEKSKTGKFDNLNSDQQKRNPVQKMRRASSMRQNETGSDHGDELTVVQKPRSGLQSENSDDKNNVPSLKLQDVVQPQFQLKGQSTQIIIDDVEGMNSSERRDEVPSLRESNVPVHKKNQGDMNEISMRSRFKDASTKKETLDSKKPNLKSSSVQQTTGQAQPISKAAKAKETELGFTRRLLDENPRGIKGLAYVIQEIRNAVMMGIIKPAISKSPGKKTRGINKFAMMFNKAASTRLKHTEKVSELLRSLEGEKGRVLDHLIKEQNFSNDDSIIEKNEVFLERIITNQKTQLDTFFTKIESRMNEMRGEIGTIKDRVGVLQKEHGTQSHENTRN